MGAARHDQHVADNRQITLRRNAGEGLYAVIQICPGQMMAVGVRPASLAGVGIDGMHKHAVLRPQPGGEIDDAIGQHGSAARRPQRDQPAIAE